MQAPNTSIPNQRSRIAVIDDDIFIREAWALLGHEFDTLTFESPEAFLDHIARQPKHGPGFDAIVTDYDFGGLSSMSGADFAKRLRPLTDSPIILSTDMNKSDIRGRELFDLFLDKNIIDWRHLSIQLPINWRRPLTITGASLQRETV